MSNTNLAILTGRLTRDAELKYTQGGMPICRFSLAVGKTWKDATGAKKEETSFIDCVIFQKMAEALGQYLTKGKLITVVGEIHQDRWDQDGQSRSKIEVIVSNLELIPVGHRDDAGAPANAGHAAAPQDAPQGKAATPQGGDMFGKAGDFDDDIPF